MTVSEASRMLEVAVKVNREAFLDLLSLHRPTDAEDLLERLRDHLYERALAGDMKAADVLVRLEERLARAHGTDAPERHVVGIEAMIERLAGGIPIANLPPELAEQLVKAITAGFEVVDGEESV